MNRSIKELADYIIAAAAVNNTIADIMEDGRISFFELRKVGKLREPVQTAFEGSGELGAELLDLDEEEWDELSDLIMDKFSNQIDTEKSRMLADGASQLISGIVTIKEALRDTTVRPELSDAE